LWPAALAILFVISGCGSDDGDSGLAEGQLSASEFTVAADRTCRRFDDQFAAIQARPARTPEAAERQAARLAGIYREALDELGVLRPPAELADAYERYLGARRRVIGYLEQARTAAARSDVAAYIAALRRAVGELAERIRLAEAAGLKQCSRPHVSLGPNGPERGF
jgi:hypothetical protein